MTALRDDVLAHGTSGVRVGFGPPAAVCPISGHAATKERATPNTGPTTTVRTVLDLDEAEEFLRMFHAENPAAGPVEARLAAVRDEVATTGTYVHTREELEFGARVAWRNSARCIGRLYWRSLRVRDLRHVRRASDIAAHCVEHLRIASNNGRIRPVISVFPPDAPRRPAPRIWNEQLVRYAGYRRTHPAEDATDSGALDGTVLGDPRYVDFTARVQQLGWTPPAERGRFDLLPLVVETADEGPVVSEVPRDAVLEVRLEHPTYEWFGDLALRWHAVPAISNMRLRIGGVDYPAAPFNGWYMGTEIGARNLADHDRYDMMRTVAERLGIDTTTERTLWKDRALVELNVAVLHSFEEAGATVTDHHTESRRFLEHLAREEKAGRSCPADWSWIVPPISGGQTPVFHRYYDEGDPLPGFLIDDDAVERGRTGAPVAFLTPALTPGPAPRRGHASASGRMPR